MIRIVLAAFSYFLIVFTAGFILGAMRMFIFAPYLGNAVAVVLEVPIMLSISWYVCRAIIARAGIPARRAHGLVMGGLAFALLMVAEVAISVVLLGRTFAQHVAGYAATGSMVGLAAQIAFALFPALQLGTSASPRRSA